MYSEDNVNRTLRGPRKPQKFPNRTPRMPINVIVPTRKFVPPTEPIVPYVYPPPNPSIDRKDSKTELPLDHTDYSSTKIEDQVIRKLSEKKKLPPRPPPKKSTPVIYDSTDEEEEEKDELFLELTRNESVHDIVASDEDDADDDDNEADEDIFRELTRKKSVHDITISDDEEDEDEEDEDDDEEEVKPFARQADLPSIPKHITHNLPPIPTVSAPGYSSDEDQTPSIPAICVPGDYSDDEKLVSTKKVDPIYNSLYFGIRCDGCEEPLTGQAMTTSGKKWHTRCFKCQICRQNLEHIAFYENHGLPYCALDYHEKFSPRCDFCQTPIEEQLITALGKTYHAGHFFCRECGKPFDEETNFLEHEGHAYCEKDYHKKFGKTCKGCGEVVMGYLLVALGSEWHKECFACADCGVAFTSSTFLVKGGKPYCEEHYYNKKTKVLPTIKKDEKKASPTPTPLNEKMCYKCNKPVQGRLVSAFGHDYHPLHFQCSNCNKLLQARMPESYKEGENGSLVCTKPCTKKNTVRLF
ncbi:hypothetical protein BD770DRAFT_392813 [Pilaira anomala]|nr:hypothetical protein BD770DRAFT_392813 [Pilaira anomala]